jgi:lysophospholipase
MASCVKAALACAFALATTACDMAAPRDALLDSRAPPELAQRFYPPEGWAWGLVQAGRLPAQRYGVSAPPVVPRAEIVILPGSGESAETWFETARDLNARGATVWVLDRAGQGGSSRAAAPRGYVHAPDPEADVQAILALRAAVVRGGPNRKVVLLAAGDAAAAAVRAVQAGARFDALILSTPSLSRDALSPLQSLAVRAGLGQVPAVKAPAWRRDGPDDAALGLTHDPWRGRLRRAWAMANPDLRDIGATLATRAAQASLAATVLKAPPLGMPVLQLTPQAAGDGPLLQRLPAAEVRRFEGARPALHLEADRIRNAWLEAVARAAGLPATSSDAKR